MQFKTYRITFDYNIFLNGSIQKMETWGTKINKCLLNFRAKLMDENFKISAGRHLRQPIKRFLWNMCYISRVSSHESNLLDLFLTTHPEPYHTSFAVSLGNSDYGLISFSYPKEHDFSEISPLRTIRRYRSANWNGLREFFPSADPSAISFQVTEII